MKHHLNRLVLAFSLEPATYQVNFYVEGALMTVVFRLGHDGVVVLLNTRSMSSNDDGCHCDELLRKPA